MRGDDAEDTPGAYYFRAKAVSTKSMQDILEEAAKVTKSELQLILERTFNYGKDGKRVLDSLKGSFYKQGCSISFQIPLAHDGKNSFEGVELSAFDLQEFNAGGELGKYAHSLIKAIDKAYKNFLSQK